MAEFTEHERTELHAKARQQVRFITLADTMEAASNRRFVAMGVIQGLCLCGALTGEQAAELCIELQSTAVQQIDLLFQKTLRDCQPPELEPDVHCTGHVDYDPASRKPEPKP